MRVLIIEDNPRFAELISRGLRDHGYDIEHTASGHDGEQLGALKAHDLIVLDVMLPDQDGILVCRNLRRRKISTPILMLTTLAATEDKVAGLNAGADDYLTKPFETDELVARVRALLRRGQGTESAVLKFADIEMDLLKRSTTRAGQPIRLTAKEFALLEYFLRNPHRVLTRTLLGERVWDMNFEDDSNVIEVYVSRLRAKIDKGREQPLLQTVIGTGYKLSDEA